MYELLNLPGDFAEEIARKYCFKGKRRQAFIKALSSDEDLSVPEKAAMTDVYIILNKHLHILSGARGGKRKELKEYFIEEYRKEGKWEDLKNMDNSIISSPDNYLIDLFSRPSEFTKLINYCIEPTWENIVKGIVNKLNEKDASNLIKSIKRKTDELLANDKMLQEFLRWVKYKSELLSNRIKSSDSLTAIRACFFDFDIALDVNRELSQMLNQKFARDFTCASMLARAQKTNVFETFSQINAMTSGLQEFKSLDPAMALVFSRSLAIKEIILKCNDKFLDENYKKFRDGIIDLQADLRNLPDPYNPTHDWYEESGENWGMKVRNVFVLYFSLGDKWRYRLEDDSISDEEKLYLKIFNDEQTQLLYKYYNATKLIVFCLDNKAFSEEFKKEITNNLLLPFPEVDSYFISDKPLFAEWINSDKFSSEFASLLLKEENEFNSKDLFIQKKLSDNLENLLSLGFEQGDHESLLEINKVLFQIYETSLGYPLSSVCKHEHSPWMILIRNRIEKKLLEYELKQISIPESSITTSSSLLCDWFDSESKNLSDLDKQVVSFLENEASEEMFKKFIVSDALLNYRFCDALALALIYYSEIVKSEITINYFDECGKGDINKSHSLEFRSMLKDLNLEEPQCSDWGNNWQPYSGYNLYFFLGLNRQHYFKSLGSLAMPELFDPSRDKAIVNGFSRLWNGHVKMDYYYNHIYTDIKHGKRWLDHVIAPIVDHRPEAGRELAIGAALRMQAMRRYNEYLAKIFELVVPDASNVKVE